MTVNEPHFIETVKAALSDQAVIDELKNSYYVFAAADPIALTFEGRLIFAKKWLSDIMDYMPDIGKPQNYEAAYVLVWLADAVLDRMAEEFKKTNATSI